MKLRDQIRLMYGLRWKTNRPPVPWKEIACVLGITVAYGVVGTIDYEMERAIEAEREAAHNAAYKQAVIACLNKGGFYYPDTKKTFLCEATEI